MFTTTRASTIYIGFITIATIVLCTIFYQPAVADHFADPRDHTINEKCVGEELPAPSWHYDEETQILCINGSITSEALYAFNVDMFPFPVSLLALNSKGGDDAYAKVIAKVVRDRGIPTYVPPGASCNMVCFEILAAGTTRFVTPTSKLNISYMWEPHPEDGKITILIEKTEAYFARVVEYSGDGAFYHVATLVALNHITPNSHILNQGDDIVTDEYYGNVHVPTGMIFYLSPFVLAAQKFAILIDP